MLMLMLMLTRSLNEWLDLLERRHPTEIEFGLDRIGRVAKQLGFLPSAALTKSPASSVSKNITSQHTNFQSCSLAKTVMTVAGTNGKGSCVAAIDNILREAGYRVGTYTSPHLIDYNERICINGHAVSDEAVCAAFEKIELARGDISLSYFEFGTLAALIVLSEAELDVAVLEVGLGGRLDAANLIDADIAVVTTIALDHQDWLGTDLNQIAAEKAAIAREGRPLICGDEKPVSGLLETAEKIGAQLFLNGRDFSLTQFGVLNPIILPPVSVACALQAVNLFDPSVSELIMEKGLSQTRIRGRYQHIDIANTQVILDVAHNPQAAELLAKRLSSLSGNIIAVVGVMSDKDIQAILEPMVPLVKVWHVCDIPSQARAATAKNLALDLTLLLLAKALRNKARYNKEQNKKEQDKTDTQSTIIPGETRVVEESSPVAAIQAALSGIESGTEAGSTVVVFGSFFTVGPVLDWFEKESESWLKNV
jgi:dihydrofolate synthase / folylpolyglutamate synthase